VAGVEPQSETVWRKADKYKVPRMCFLNKMDRTGANFYSCVDTILGAGANPAVLQLPIGTESDFLGVIDLVTMEAIVWRGEDLGASFDVIPLSECNDIDLVDDAVKAKAKEWHDKLVEAVVEQDEDVLMAYLEGQEHDVPP
jgi:elongation factor G